LEKASGAKKRVSIDDTLTVIFTSGSTGDPKGVVLNHFNVDSNVEAVSQVAHSKEGLDKLLGTLPLFHSFGYMSMWLGLNHSLGIVLHPNPLDAPTIGPLIEKHKVTMIMTTPTFLKIYMRRIMPGQLGSVRCIITGAEKLPKSLSDNFLANFGIRPIEGYGATECSPVIATSTLDVRKAGVFQPGSYHGTVGQPLPGVVTCIVDPENFEELPLELEGMLLVKGPNVMQGYLGQEELTEKVMHDGWYITGDIAMMNADGYLKITDRLSRFSKIGGEMVPHGSIEEALHTAANASLPVFAVTAIPDASKGERLAVLHTLNKDKIPAIHEKLSAQGLPNLFIPRLDHFIKVEKLPMLGTGKLDLRTIKARAAEFLAKK